MTSKEETTRFHSSKQIRIADFNEFGNIWNSMLQNPMLHSKQHETSRLIFHSICRLIWFFYLNMQVSGKIYGKPMETPIFLARCPADFTVYDESPAVSRPQCPSAAMSRDRTRSPHGTWEQNRKKNDLPIENIIILHSKLWKYQESFILYI